MRLKASGCRELKSARFASTQPRWSAAGAQRSFDRLASACLLDRYGGDCYNYAMLAAGFVDIIAEAGLKPFDIVPLLPMLEQSGCVVSSWDGGSVLAGGNVVAAASAELHAEALAVLRG
jgi:fructose-1,6-bisphosphatase/inositol monophosphatase family enzyme